MTLKVSVLVTLHRHADAGGHVKSWERFAAAARAFAGRLSLDVYFLGDEAHEEQPAGNVRLIHLPPRLGTKHLAFLRTGAGDTDLAPYRPKLAQRLSTADVIHVTDTFAFGQTGRRVAAEQGIPLAYSIQTDLPHFTEVYAREVIEKVLPDRLARFAVDTVQVPQRAAGVNERSVHSMIDAADHVFASNDETHREVAEIKGPTAVSLMRRGLNFDRFDPARRDRGWLAERFGVPPRSVVMLFAGRADTSKKVMTAARAAKSLVEEGYDIRFFLAGEGAQRTLAADLLGSRAIAPGALCQDDLARVYASADLFVFPSESETRGMVVLEAKAAGLPVVVRAGQATAEAVAESGTDGVTVPSSRPGAWVEACRPLVEDAALRAAMGRAASAWTRRHVPTWSVVLEADLLSHWERLAGGRVRR